MAVLTYIHIDCLETVSVFHNNTSIRNSAVLQLCARKIVILFGRPGTFSFYFYLKLAMQYRCCLGEVIQYGKNGSFFYGDVKTKKAGKTRPRYAAAKFLWKQRCTWQSTKRQTPQRGDPRVRPSLSGRDKTYVFGGGMSLPFLLLLLGVG